MQVPIGAIITLKSGQDIQLCETADAIFICRRTRSEISRAGHCRQTAEENPEAEKIFVGGLSGPPRRFYSWMK